MSIVSRFLRVFKTQNLCYTQPQNLSLHLNLCAKVSLKRVVFSEIKNVSVLACGQSNSTKANLERHMNLFCGKGRREKRATLINCRFCGNVDIKDKHATISHMLGKQ